MTLQLTHFDAKLRLDLALREPVRNCLAEYLFPDASFALGEVDPETVKASDLRAYQGMSLQFASGQRMYFCARNVGEWLYPNPSDRIAYGSLPFTPNRTFHELKQMRVLVIDDGTGENGGILPYEVARRLVGDCHGKLSLELAQQLTSRDDTPFQFRLGIRPQAGHQFYRIAKGTLAPNPRLDPLTSTVSYQGVNAKLGYDLVLPTSAFKGRKGEQSIAPGEYILDLGIGVKALAEYGRQRLGTQVFVNYPKGVERDILPIAREQARELSRVQGDIHALAQTYVRMYEERQEARMAESQGLSGDLDVLGDGVDDLAEPERESQEQRLYEILKADLSQHGQLLEHPNTVNELRDAVQNLWRDIALARSIRVQSALAQPSLDLKENEVCVSKMPDGMELIVTRSPLVNSNGVILLTNRHLPQLMRQQGVIHIHPETAAKHLQADFDGDRLAFERADRFPHLAAEIEEALKPENRYPDVVKRDKVPYQGTVEEIAVSAVRNDIGKIANPIMGAVSLRWETTLLPEGEKARYVSEAVAYYRKLLARDVSPDDSFRLPDSYREEVAALASLPSEPSPDAVGAALQYLRDIQFKVVGDLSNELQVAVDGPKSALRPDQEAIATCKILSSYREVGWLKEKDRSKSPELFRTRPMAAANYSPIDQLARMASTYWQQYCLQERPAHQFRSLFPEPAANFKEIAKEIKDAYNSYLSAAGALKDIRQAHPETVQPYLIPDPKTGELVEKRVIEVEGKVLAPFSGESPSLLPGTAFRAQVHSSLGASITATTRQGNSLTITQVNKFAYPAQEWRGERAEIAVALTSLSGSRGEVPLVTLNQLPLGILDKESARRLGERNLLTQKGVRLPVTLERSLGTTATLEVLPDSLAHPWQRRELAQAMEQEGYYQQRERYREQYQAYFQEVVRDEAFASAPEREIDREVAVRAYRDGADSQQVTCILSQSDRVLQMRETIPKLYGWEEYLAKAKEYVREVKAESLERCQIERE